MFTLRLIKKSEVRKLGYKFVNLSCIFALLNELFIVQNVLEKQNKRNVSSRTNRSDDSGAQ